MSVLSTRATTWDVVVANREIVFLGFTEIAQLEVRFVERPQRTVIYAPSQRLVDYAEAEQRTVTFDEHQLAITFTET